MEPLALIVGEAPRGKYLARAPGIKACRWVCGSCRVCAPYKSVMVCHCYIERPNGYLEATKQSTCKPKPAQRQIDMNFGG